MKNEVITRKITRKESYRTILFTNIFEKLLCKNLLAKI